MALPGLRDSTDEMLQLLRRIARNMSDPTENDPEEPTEEKVTGPRYFTSGPNPVAVTDETFGDPVTFGFRAHTVNIRSTDDIVITFISTENEGTHIKILGIESPFTIGGDRGINADRIYIRKAASASTDPGIQLIAYK